MEKRTTKLDTMRGAAFLQFISKYANIAIQLLITAVLARLISPEDFGLLAIVSVFTAFFQLFSDMGLGVAIIQYRELSEDDYGGLFIFSIILSALISALFCLSSLPISIFYHNQQLVPICILASPALLFYTLNMVPNGLMLKDKRFVDIAIRLLVSTLVSGAISIILAFLGCGSYALVIQTDLAAFIVLIWNLIARPLHSLNFHFAGTLKKVFSYSAYQCGFSIINYFSRNLDNLVIGRVLGTNQLGYYDKAYKLTTYPMSSISSVVASVIQPYMAEKQDQPNLIFECWFKVTKILSLVGAFVSSLFIVAAPEIILLFYGSNWSPAIPIFQILSLSIYFQMIGNPSGAFFQSLGRTDLMFRQGFMCTLLTILGLTLGMLLGSLHAVAFCVSIAFCLQIVPIMFFLIIRAMRHSISIITRFIPEVLIAIVSIICNWIAMRYYVSNGIVLTLIIKFIITATVFIIGYYVTGNMKYLKLLLRNRP